MASHRENNLTPKKVTVGVALKTLLLNIRSSRLGDYRRLLKISRLATVTLCLLYLSGYQPVIGFPPLQRAQVHAEEQSIQQQQDKIDSIRLAQPFILPHPGYMSTPYSSWHPGIDIAVGLGTPIHPITDGTVTDTHYDFFGLGHAVTIEHELNIKSTYGHMDRIYVKPGDKVTASSTIGNVGMTGHTSGPHTHLEITKNGQYINPKTLLPALDQMPIFVENTTNQGGRDSKPVIDLKKELKINL